MDLKRSYLESKKQGGNASLAEFQKRNLRIKIKQDAQLKDINDSENSDHQKEDTLKDGLNTTDDPKNQSDGEGVGNLILYIIKGRSRMKTFIKNFLEKV